jgi:iron complex transport system substrate-binding protein
VGRPAFSVGRWVPDLVIAAGGRPVAAQPGGRSAQASWEQIAAERPEVVVVAPCGFRLDGAAAQAGQVTRQLPGIPVWAIDADGLVVRPGPRLVDGVEALAAILHPGQVPAPPAGRIRRIA